MIAADFEVYKDLLMEKSGLVLTPDKAYLIDSRLTPVARKRGMADLNALTVALKGIPDAALVNDIVEAMTTNETSFFRDSRPFDIFKEVVIPYMKEKRAAQRAFKIWCAAASSGQEPYSLAMILKEAANQIAGWNTPILGTDISHAILEQARKGIYSQFEVQRGMPIQLLMKYFTQLDEKWEISNDIKAMVKYDYRNLLDNMSSLGRFDIIFCRNVLIYFDEKTKRQVLEAMDKQLEDDGFLFLGGAETVIGITEAFKPVPEKRGLYAKTGSIHLQKTPEPPKASESGTQALA